MSVCASVDRIVSTLYLQQYSLDSFHICPSYQATSEGVSRVMLVSNFKNLKFWRILKNCKFDFVFFRLGMQYDSMVWVIMRRRGYPQQRRSSCSSYDKSGANTYDEYSIMEYSWIEGEMLATFHISLNTLRPVEGRHFRRHFQINETFSILPRFSLNFIPEAQLAVTR